MSEPKLWDYREQRWGWALMGSRPTPGSVDWTQVDTCGFGIGLSEGDILGLAGPAYRAGNKDAVAWYQLTQLKYFSDPPDMWSARLVYLPESPPGEFEKLTLSQVFFVRSDR